MDFGWDVLRHLRSDSYVFQGRSKVRVKLNLQPLERNANAKEGSPDQKSYDAEYVSHRTLVSGSLT